MQNYGTHQTSKVLCFLCQHQCYMISFTPLQQLVPSHTYDATATTDWLRVFKIYAQNSWENRNASDHINGKWQSEITWSSDELTWSAQYPSVQIMLPQRFTLIFAHLHMSIPMLNYRVCPNIIRFQTSKVLLYLFSGLLFDLTHWTHIPFFSPLRCSINGWIRDGTRSESQRFHNLTFRLSNAGDWTRVYENVAGTTAAKFDFWALLIATRNLEPVRWPSGISTDRSLTSQVTKIPHTICLAPVHTCNQSSYIMKIDCKWKCMYHMMGEHEQCQLPFLDWQWFSKLQHHS